MHTALLDSTVMRLNALRQHLIFSEHLRNEISKPMLVCSNEGEKCPSINVLCGDAPDVTNWRLIDHCTAVTRAYALFEDFVDKVLREYIVFISKSYRFRELGDDFATKYTRGVGQILVDHKSRYEKIDVATLLRQSIEALSDHIAYEIQPETLLRAEQNLRMGELQRRFGHCGFTDVERWLTSHRAINSFFKSESRLSQTVASELKQIVDYRNEAAHGYVDQTLGTEILIEFIDFVEALLTSITDFVQYDMVRRAKDLGTAKALGIITECFRGDVIIAKIVGSTLSVGDTLYIYGKGAIDSGKIESIQLNDVDHETVTIVEECEVGLRLDTPGRLGCELVRLT